MVRWSNTGDCKIAMKTKTLTLKTIAEGYEIIGMRNMLRLETRIGPNGPASLRIGDHMTLAQAREANNDLKMTVIVK